MFDCDFHTVFEWEFFVPDIPTVFPLVDLYGAVFVDPAFGGDASPSAAIERVGAVTVDFDHDGAVKLHTDGFGVDTNKVSIVLQLFGGPLVSALVDEFGGSSLEVHDDVSVVYHHRVQYICMYPNGTGGLSF